MDQKRMWNYVLGGWGMTALVVLWTLYCTQRPHDLYKLFALLGLTSGLIGVALLGLHFSNDHAWRRPIGLAFLVLGFFLHGFANFAPDLFLSRPDEVAYTAPQCTCDSNAQDDQAGQDDGDMDADPGQDFPGV